METTDKISDLDNNCTLRAVKEVSRQEDAAIIAAFKKHGYRPNKGMRHDNWTAAARDLGLELEEIRTRYNPGIDQRYGCMSLAQFIKRNPMGTFFVSVSAHALVVRDGKVVDGGQLRLRRKVKRAKKVLNAPAIVAATVARGFTINTRVGKRHGTDSWYRYGEFTAYVANNPSATVADVLANTSYTKADFTHDVKKGFISYGK